MRILFLFIFFGAFAVFPAFTQELVITDTLKKRERIFYPEKSFLFMTTQNPEYTKGKIVAVRDTSIVFFLVEEEVPLEKTISLKDITVIRKATKTQYFSYMIGGLFLLNGAFLTIEGPTLRNRGIGVLSFAAGLIPFFFTPKTYELGGRFQLSVRNPSPEEQPMEDKSEQP
jgi:hypothetical protein